MADDTAQSDVFLSYARENQALVKRLAERLEDEAGLSVWLDEWALVPGVSWQSAMAEGIQRAGACAICFGAETIAGWFEQEIQKALDRGAQDKTFRVIVVLLPGANQSFEGVFIDLRTWVDFRHDIEDPEALRRLVAGIQGKSPGRPPRAQSESRTEQYSNPIGPVSLQPQTWPEKPNIPTPPRIGKGNLRSAFVHERAEYDQGLLFADSTKLFWIKHPCFCELEDAAPISLGHAVSLIVGKPGTGKTAFAFALGKYNFTNEGKLFGVHLNGLPGAERPSRDAAKRLLDFGITHPTHLAHWSAAQLDLLANVLNTKLGQPIVLSYVEQYAAPDKWRRWLYRATPEERKAWQESAGIFFPRLRQAVKTNSTSQLNHTDWLNAFTACAEFLGFEALRLVFDLAAEVPRTWYETAILPQMDDWTASGWNVLIFTEPQVISALNLESQITHTLAWTNSQLTAWAEHRWNGLNQHHPLVEIFAEGGVERLSVLAEGNPRRFTQIWKQLVALKSNPPYTQNEIEAAAEQGFKP